MKKLLLITGIGLFGISNLKAQDQKQEIPQDAEVIEQKHHYEKENNGYTLETETTYKTEDGFTVFKEEVEHSEQEPRSSGGKVLNTVGHGAKEAGKGVKNATGWTWDKLKHNKLTKNLFDQPGDDDATASAEYQED